MVRSWLARRRRKCNNNSFAENFVALASASLAHCVRFQFRWRDEPSCRTFAPVLLRKMAGIECELEPPPQLSEVPASADVAVACQRLPVPERRLLCICCRVQNPGNTFRERGKNIGSRSSYSWRPYSPTPQSNVQHGVCLRRTPSTTMACGLPRRRQTHR